MIYFQEHEPALDTAPQENISEAETLEYDEVETNQLIEFTLLSFFLYCLTNLINHSSCNCFHLIHVHAMEILSELDVFPETRTICD